MTEARFNVEDRAAMDERGTRRCAPTLPVFAAAPELLAAQSPMDDEIGLRDHAHVDSLSRKFRVEGVIGCGGMGVVIAAHHLALDKRVAIKLMRPELRARKDLVRRFLREARAAVRLNSRHAAR